jgi:hypothetical protein
MKFPANIFESMRAALGGVPRRTLALAGIVLVILALLSSLVVIRARSTTSTAVDAATTPDATVAPQPAQAFSVDVRVRPRAEQAVLATWLHRETLAHNCTQIGLETMRVAQREMPIQKYLCTQTDGSSSVLSYASFVARGKSVALMGTGPLGSYNAKMMSDAVFTAFSPSHRKTAHSAPKALPPPSKTASNRNYSVNGFNFSIAHVRPIECSESDAKPKNDDTASTLMITNQSSKPIGLDQVNLKGDHTNYASIPPGLSLKAVGYATQPWIVNSGGSCLTVVILDKTPGTLVIK